MNIIKSCLYFNTSDFKNIKSWIQTINLHRAEDASWEVWHIKLGALCWMRLSQRGRYCPVVQLLLEAQTGFDATIHLGWMGTVGSQKELSIQAFIEQPRYQHSSLCIRMTERLLVSQVGYGKKHQEFGLFQMLSEWKYKNSWKHSCRESVPNNSNTSKERKRLQIQMKKRIYFVLRQKSLVHVGIL